MLKLAFKNTTEKPFRLAAGVLALVFAVAMIFTVLSFNQAVYDYFLHTLTVECGETDIKLSHEAGDTRIMNSSAVDGLVDAEYAVGVMSVYGTCEGKYIHLKGIDKNNIEKLNSVNVSEGKKLHELRSDEAVISISFAEQFQLGVGDRFVVEMFGAERGVYVGTIAEESGHFDSSRGIDTVIVSEEYVAGFFSEYASFGKVYNQVYVKLASGSVDQAIEVLKSSPEFSGMTVERAVDYEKLEQDTGLYSATVVVVGVAAILFAAFAIMFLSVVKCKERSSQIFKLKSLGATSKQLFCLYALEAVIVGAVGSALGLAFSDLAMRLIFKLSFGTATTVSVAAYKYVIAFFGGFALYFIAEQLPLVRSLKQSLREVSLESKDGSATFSARNTAIVGTALAVSLVLEFTIDAVRGIFGFVSVILCLVWLTQLAPLFLKGIGYLLCKIKSPVALLTGRALSRDRACKIKVQIVSAAAAVCILLLVASGAMATYMGSYTGDSDSYISVRNTPNDTTELRSELTANEGVISAVDLLWTEGRLGFKNKETSIQTFALCGNADRVFDFEYITEKAVVDGILNDKTANKAILDVAYNKAYGLEIGDEVVVSIEDNPAVFTVGGFVRSQYNIGNYVLVNADCLAAQNGLAKYNMVWLRTDGRADLNLKIRELYAPKNYQVVTLAELEKIAISSLDSVFSFVEIICYFVGVLAIFATILNVQLSRASQNRERTQLLSVGTSRRQLFATELFTHLFIGLVSFVLSLGFSALMLRCTFDGVLVFGLYYDYWFSMARACAAAGVLALAVSAMPIILAYWRSYTIKVGTLKVN